MSEPEQIESHTDDEGRTWALLRRGEAYEVRLDGVVQFASDRPRNEQELVELAFAPLKGRDDITLLLGGLGSGRLVKCALAVPGVRRIIVAERSQLVIGWERRYFAASNGDAVSDARVKVHCVEVRQLVKQARLGQPGLLPDEGVMGLILDVDAGPSALSRPGNAALYTDEGLELLEGAIRPGGVLCLWSSSRDLELYRRVTARYQNPAEIAVPADLPDGGSNLDYVYRGRRAALDRTAAPPTVITRTPN
jgi:spermidine synthase